MQIAEYYTMRRAVQSSAPAPDASEAALALARLWTKQLAYGFWQAETVRVDKRQVELQGATRVSLRGHYLTVHLLAQETPEPATLPRAGRSRRWFTGGRPDVAVA